MAKHDFIPRTEGDYLAWHDNFSTQLAVLGPSLGLSAGEITAVATRNTDLHAKLNAAEAADAVKQAKTADKQTSFNAGKIETRAIRNRIIHHPNFTTGMGQQLGTTGPEDSTDLSTAQPTLRLESVSVGMVQIGFNKSIATAVRISSKRGAETTFTFLAIDSASPYVDTRPNLGPGPETRYYQAQYLIGDEAVGQLSDILAVTVPGA